MSEKSIVEIKKNSKRWINKQKPAYDAKLILVDMG